MNCQLSIVNRQLWWQVSLLLVLWIHCFVVKSEAQIENVPVNNQVYEFLNRMGVKGILPMYSNTMIPISRKEVAGFLVKVDRLRNELGSSEIVLLDKFQREFKHEIDPLREDADVLFRDGSANYFYSDKEKYIYSYSDSSVSTYLEFIGTLEHRVVTGDSYGDTHASFEEHGGRIRGTIKNRLGYYLQATNGTLFGDRNFALSDTRLKGNVKFKDLNSSYFDFTEAYLRGDLDWFNIQFGREYTLIGTGYSDRLLLSDNAPVFDFLKLDFHYKSVRFISLHGALVDSSVSGSPFENKYLALHRIQFSLFNRLSIGMSEMIIYRRSVLDFAYLNPINFYKSSEHSLRDRDNAFLNFDLEYFPIQNYKFYGTWLIDDMDFKKMGTGWWGNEFGWQGGAYVTEVGGISNIDAVIEYTRMEPYVYSNRIIGNEYTNNHVGLGNHLEPNSDEWFIQFRYYPSSKLRLWVSYAGSRHGENFMQDGKIINVGGDILTGHRNGDSEKAIFLDGNRVRYDRVQAGAMYEPFTNFFISGLYEIRQTKKYVLREKNLDHYFALKFHIEY
jgi:hypothetical protein